MSASVRAAVEEAVSSGLHGVMAGAAALSAVAFATAWFIRAAPATKPVAPEAAVVEAAVPGAGDRPDTGGEEDSVRTPPAD
jgi:hypothetical protein